MTALLVALTAGAAWAANQINCDGFCIGTNGKDEMKGSANSDDMEAERGNDVMYGRGGEDVMFGDEGADTLYGNEGDDTLEEYNTSGDKDKLYAQGGDDEHVDAEDGDGLDLVDCGEGQDTAFVDPGDKVASNC